MRKLLFFLFLFFIFDIVYAKQLDINNKIIYFDKIEDYDLQGFTNTDKYIFMVLVNDDDSKSIIRIYDIKNYSLVKELPGNSLGHANDITYNSKDNRIYIIDNGNTTIHVFDADNFEYIDTIKIDVSIRSLTYLEDKDEYAVRTVNSGYILNKDFSLKHNYPFIMGMNMSLDVCRQGWSYYDGNIYYVNWSWLRKGGDGTNTIYIYDLHGHRIDELTTRDNLGEMEDISFIDDKMLLGFNEYDNHISFYLEDIPNVEKYVFKEENVINSNTKKDFKYYYLVIPSLILGLIFISNRKRLK